MVLQSPFAERLLVVILASVGIEVDSEGVIAVAVDVGAGAAKERDSDAARRMALRKCISYGR